MIVLFALVYFAYVSWLVIATYLNYVVMPLKASKYSVSNRVSLTYALAWSVAFTAPIAYGEFFT